MKGYWSLGKDVVNLLNNRWTINNSEKLSSNESGEEKILSAGEESSRQNSVKMFFIFIY